MFISSIYVITTTIMQNSCTIALQIIIGITIAIIIIISSSVVTRSSIMQNSCILALHVIATYYHHHH